MVAHTRHAEALIAPHYLARRARFGYRAIDLLRFDRTAARIDHIDALAAGADRLTARLCLDIHTAVPAAPPVDRRQLLSAQRSLFNRRPLAPDLEQTVARYLADHQRQLLADCCAHVRELAAAKEAIAGEFELELVDKRQRMAELLADPDLQRGVQLSRPQLLATVESYIAAVRGGGELTQRLRKAEVSLISYVQRTALKPTPLGSFTGIAWGQIATPRGAPEPRRLVRLTRGVLSRIEEALAKTPSFRPFSLVRLSGTCRIENGRLELLAATDSTTFRTIHLQPALRAIVNQLRGGALAQQKLEAALVDQGAAPDVAGRFIDGLIQLGVLESDFGIPDQTDDYLAALLARIREIPHASDIGELLARIGEVEQRLAPADANERQRLCAELRALTVELTDRLGSPPIDLDQMRSLFYEDVTTSAPIAPPPALLSSLREPFNLLRALSPLFSEATVEQLSLFHLFEKLYPNEGEFPSILEFYRRYSETTPEERTPRLRDDEATELRRLQQRFFDHLKTRLAAQPATDELAIEPPLLRSLVAELPAYVVPWESIAFRCQLARDSEDRVRAVLNATGLGYGKPFSRFCPLFADDAEPLAARVRAATRHHPEHRIYADLVAVFGLNINLHPPLLPAEIVYPGSRGQPGRRALPLHDLVVVPDRTRRRLTLRLGAQGAPVVIVPLNFQYPLLAPALYRFLCHFGPGRETQLVVWDRYDAHCGGTAVRRYPRLMLGSLVVERATWKLPHAASPPARSEHEAELQRFIALRRWQRGLGLPETVFYRNHPFLVAADGRIASKRPFKPRDRKPNYLDFRNAFQLRAFDRHLRDHEGELTIQEFLPRAFGDHDGSADEHATEYVFELSAFEHAEP